MTDREAMKLALEALVDFGWHIENCPQFPTWAEPKKHPPCTCGYDTTITALRQALDRVPDTMKMLEPDMGIDRGAWDDVPDATKWVDELRGGDETEEEPVACKHNRYSVDVHEQTGTCYDCGAEGRMRFVVDDTAPPKQPECNPHPDAPHGFNRESSHSLGRYVCDCEGWEPERKWQGLTDEEIAEGAKQSWVDKQAFESAVWWAEEKLKEKNHG